MVFLKRIYSKPDGLFDPVDFKQGINVIYGEKSETSRHQDSLNYIGKSTFIDLINFCLLSNIPPRLKRAKSFLDEHSIVLEIEIDGVGYSIERNTKKPSIIYWGRTNQGKSEYQLNDLKRELCDLFFKDNNYKGYYNNEWFRQLLPFFIKVQQKGKNIYKNAVNYIEGMKTLEAIQYHLFLLGIDNTLAKDNCNLTVELKRREPVVKEIESFVKETYKLQDIQDANNMVSKLERDIKRLSENINVFKLGEQYADIEKQANKITEKINEYIFRNHQDRRKIESYKKSFEQDIKISPSKVERIYKELNEQLGFSIKKTLQQAVDFKNNLIKSRQNFISDEIRKLESDLQQRESEINKLDGERAKLFGFLAEKEAIKDLTNAFYLLNKKKEEISQIESKLQTYNDFHREILDLKENEARLDKDINNFIIKTQGEIGIFRTIFHALYNTLYVEQKDRAIFNIAAKLKSDAKFDIKIDAPGIYSEGKNRGCILLYDLAVIFQAIQKGRTFPGFLIHDGIFDGIHKSHFVALMNYLEIKSSKDNFQYIFTANKEDIFMKDALNCGELTFDLKNKAIAIYTPENKLFKRDF